MRTLTVVGSPPPLWPGRAERLPALRSELLVVPGNSYRVAASDPDRCAQASLAFIRRHR